MKCAWSVVEDSIDCFQLYIFCYAVWKSITSWSSWEMNVLISLNSLCFTESINAGREKYLVEFVCCKQCHCGPCPACRKLFSQANLKDNLPNFCFPHLVFSFSSAALSMRLVVLMHLGPYKKLVLTLILLFNFTINSHTSLSSCEVSSVIASALHCDFVYYGIEWIMHPFMMTVSQDVSVCRF